MFDGTKARLTPAVPLLSLVQRRAVTCLGPQSKVVRAGSKLSILKGGCQMAQKIPGAGGKAPPLPQQEKCPRVAGRTRGLGWQSEAELRQGPICPGLGLKRGALEATTLKGPRETRQNDWGWAA